MKIIERIFSDFQGEFTSLLYELVNIREFKLSQALEIMKDSGKEVNEDKKTKKISNAAEFLYKGLKEGDLFSNLLKVCPYISFDSTYISFIRFAERTGRIEDVLDFLNKKNIRKKENTNKVIDALMYPCFVLFFAILIFFFLYFYLGKSLNADLLSDFTKGNRSFVFLPILFVVSFLLIFFLLIKNILGTNKIYEAFLSCSFLISAGIDLATAVCVAGIILGADSHEGRFFMDAGEKLGYGFSLRNAFFGDKKKTAQRLLKIKMGDFLYYAEKSDGRVDVFDKISTWINQRDEKRRNGFLKMIEPAFIGFTGIFLLSIFLSISMPFFSGGMNLFEGFYF